jgi:hypothetical protein
VDDTDLTQSTTPMVTTAEEILKRYKKGYTHGKDSWIPIGGHEALLSVRA